MKSVIDPGRSWDYWFRHVLDYVEPRYTTAFACAFERDETMEIVGSLAKSFAGGKSQQELIEEFKKLVEPRLGEVLTILPS